MSLKILSRLSWIFLFLAIMAGNLYSQERMIYGVVHAFDSIPLTGAEIYIKSTKQSVFTDAQGNFSAPCNFKDRIEVKEKGFDSKKVKINDKIKIVAINLRLQSAAKMTEEELRIYAIGYGHVLEKDKTTATESLRKNESSFSRYGDMYELIRGQFAGVEVTNSGIIIRGSNSLNSSSAALIVVDGVIMESDILRVLRPVNIKNVRVIKDGSAAIYGSRGANGVVIIETNKGGDNVR